MQAELSIGADAACLAHGKFSEGCSRLMESLTCPTAIIMRHGNQRYDETWLGSKKFHFFELATAQPNIAVNCKAAYKRILAHHAMVPATPFSELQHHMHVSSLQ